MQPFAYTVPCSRPGVAAEYDDFGNLLSAAIPALEFNAVFVPAWSGSGSRIVDGVLRETTVTKPTLYVEGRPALSSGDYLVVDGVSGWEVDGDPAVFKHPWSGWEPPLVVELRRTVG